MAFTIQSRDLAGNVNQSHIYDTDIRILTDGLAGVGVVSGCGVTAQGSPNMTVAIAAGTIRIASGALVTVASGNGTIGTADATNPRIDLISASNAGVKTVTAGTAAVNPKPPDLPAGNVGLAMVYVAANDTAISTGEITDKRVSPAGAKILQTFLQAKGISAGGGGPGTLTLDLTPTVGSTLFCLAAANGNGISSITQTNVAWTLARHDNVASVGALDLWVGVISASPGTSVAIAGMTGAAAAAVYEVAATTYGSLGSGSIYNGTITNKYTQTLRPPVGDLVAFIINNAANGTLASAPLMTCPCEMMPNSVAVHGFALGIATGQGVQGAILGTGNAYSLIDIVVT